MTETDTSFSSAIDQALADVLGEPPAVDVSEAAIDTADVDESNPIEVDEDVSDETEPDTEVDDADEDATDGDDADNGDEVEIVTLSPDQVVEIDGQQVKVSEALSLRADYTKKTQALADERKQFETERDSFGEKQTYLENLESTWVRDPSEVVAGFAGAAEDPEGAFARAAAHLARTEGVDANLTVVKTVMELISQDLIDDDLRQMLGFDEQAVSKIKEQMKSDHRIRKLERELDQVKSPKGDDTGRDAAIAEARKKLEADWEQLVTAEPDLSSLDADALSKVRTEVARYALEKGGIPLDVAYEALQAKRLRAERAKTDVSDATRRRKAEVSKKTNRPTNGGAPARRSNDIGDVIAETIAELSARRS